MSGPTFSYNNPRFQGQTVFIKRGKFQGKLGLVVQILDDENFVVSQGEFGKEKITFHRSEFLVHRYRKIKVPIDRIHGRAPDMI